MSETVGVMFVCLGNICRSPLAKGVFLSKLAERGLSDKFDVESSGTSAYHVGEPPDPGSVEVARRVGIDLTRDRSQQLNRGDMAHYDYLIAMDRSNLRNMRRLGTQYEGKLHLLRSFEPDNHDPDVPDPWGGGLRGFETVYQIVDRATDGLLDFIVEDRGL